MMETVMPKPTKAPKQATKKSEMGGGNISSVLKKRETGGGLIAPSLRK
jgi:hypothetical protein